MKKVFFFLSVVLIPYPIFGQAILVHKNGETIEYSDLKVTAEGIKLKTKEKGNILLSHQAVISLNFINSEETLYPKALTGNESSFEFVPRIIEGPINVYEKIETGKTQYGSYSNSYYYIEKGSDFKFVFQHNGLFAQNRKDGIQILRTFVEDTPDVLKKMESSDFKLDYESLTEIIKEYNILNFKKNHPVNVKKSSVFFYSKMKKNTNEDLKLILNDSLEFKIPARRTISVSLPIDEHTKICIKSSTQSECLLISPSAFYIKYFEVDYNPKSEKLEIKNIHSRDAQNYIRFVNSQGG